jgi:hypothetical protein
LKLTRERREVNCSQRVNGGFPTPLGTEALHAGILVCLKDRVEAYLSNAFGEIFYVHIAPTEQVRFEGWYFSIRSEVGHEYSLIASD